MADYIPNIQIPPPEKFTFKPGDWPKWIRRFQRYRIATGLNDKSGASQVNTFIYSMGEEADDIFISFGLTEEQSDDFNTVKDKFEKHFVVKRNIIFERAKFNVRKQKPDEPVDNFITDLYCLAENCNYGALKEELIRDRIVVGIKDETLSEKLQLDSEPTLQKAITQARQKETVKQQQKILHPSEKVNVDRVMYKNKNYKPTHNPYPNPRHKGKQNQKKNNTQTRCTRCLGAAHSRQDCPARDARCDACNFRGHYSKACLTNTRKTPRKVHEIQMDESEYEEEPDEFFLGVVISNLSDDNKSVKSPWQADICVNNNKINFKLDTGADVTVIPTSVDHSSNTLCDNLQSTKKILYGPCKQILPCQGKFTAQLSTLSRDKTVYEDIYVIDNLDTPLLSRTAVESLELLHRVHNVSSKQYKDQMVTQYSKLFKGLGQMDEEYRITLKENSIPFAISVPRKVAMPLYEETKRELEKMLKMDVIAKVDRPTDWCAPMVVAPKANNKVRICVDLTKLNDFVKRENYPLPAVDTTLGRLSGAKVFTKLDANSGFWQIKMAPESRHLTTFITPWGRYCFNVLPYGINSGSEKLQKCMSRILEGLEGIECSIDDVLIHGPNQLIHDQRLKAVLERLTQAKVTLNKEKCTFSVNKIKFLGHELSAQGINADPDKIQSIKDIPPPSSVSELRTFLGMVNHLGKFAGHLASKTQPLRELLKSDTEWTWGSQQSQAFSNIKDCLIKSPVLALYDINKLTKISADASSYGLGGVLLQLQDDKSWRPVIYMSRAMTPTEMRYAQIEKEALALTWACEKSSDFIIGKEIIVETDHKPLVPLLTKYTLDKLPPRIQRYRMRLMRFQFSEVRHVPGKEMYISDTLSRLQLRRENNTPTIEELQMDAFVASVVDAIPVSDVKLNLIREAQEQDETCKKIKDYTLHGWPDKHTLSDIVKPYWSVQGEISVIYGTLLKGSRLSIPSNLRMDILDRIHEGHQGIVKCRQRAMESVWWPGLSREIQDMVENCRICAKQRPNRAEPLLPSPVPDRPWQVVATDLFYLKDCTYLIVIDHYSKYIEVSALNKSTKSNSVISALKCIFARHGIPEELRSDNGPQYSCAETHFAKEWGFKHNTSSPRYPQSNGEAERGVQTVKHILKKEKDPAKALLAYRSTPLSSGFSPAQLLMGRRIRTTVPTFHTNLVPKWPDMQQYQQEETERKRKQKRTFDNHRRAHNLPVLSPNSEVFVKDLNRTGTIIKPSSNPRSYVVQTPESTFVRNRAHLTPLQSPKRRERCEPTRLFNTPGNSQTSPVLNNRPKRVIKPSLKVRENLGLQ